MKQRKLHQNSQCAVRSARRVRAGGKQVSTEKLWTKKDLAAAWRPRPPARQGGAEAETPPPVTRRPPGRNLGRCPRSTRHHCLLRTVHGGWGGEAFNLPGGPEVGDLVGGEQGNRGPAWRPTGRREGGCRPAWDPGGGGVPSCLHGVAQADGSVVPRGRSRDGSGQAGVSQVMGQMCLLAGGHSSPDLRGKAQLGCRGFQMIKWKPRK